MIFRTTFSGSSRKLACSCAFVASSGFHSNGYSLIRKIKKLRSEFASLDGPDIARSKRAGEALFYVEERTVDVHVGRVRKAINRGNVADPIRTVRGAGYALDDRFGRPG